MAVAETPRGLGGLLRPHAWYFCLTLRSMVTYIFWLLTWIKYLFSL